MRVRIEPAVRAWWSGRGGAVGRVVDVVSAPLEGAFRVATVHRARAYDLGRRPAHRPTIPVISVGNLTVGGSGKTPFTGWLVAQLANKGLRPAVVTRGYGQDEVALHLRWNPSVQVYAAADRRIAIERAAKAGARLAVMDDGFQHRAVARDVDLVLVSAEQSVRLRDRLLPRGPYREPWSALVRADAVMVTRRTADQADVDAVAARVATVAPSVPVLHATLSVRGWTDTHGRPAAAPEHEALAVTSVAGPEDAVRMMRGACKADLELMSFPDHHRYTQAEIRRILARAAGRPLATTEKDAVKLIHLLPPNADVRVLALHVAIEDPGQRLWEVLDPALRLCTSD